MSQYLRLFAFVKATTNARPSAVPLLSVFRSWCSCSSAAKMQLKGVACTFLQTHRVFKSAQAPAAPPLTATLTAMWEVLAPDAAMSAMMHLLWRAVSKTWTSAASLLIWGMRGALPVWMCAPLSRPATAASAWCVLARQGSQVAHSIAQCS